MSSAWTAKDLGVTLGSIASESAFEVASQSADWFASRRDAAALVERYTTAAVWCFVQDNATFHRLGNMDPVAAMKAYQTERLTRFVGVAPNQDDRAVWRMLQEDAEALARAVSAPEAQASATPLDHVTQAWFVSRARPLFDILPAASAKRLVETTGELFSAVRQIVDKAAGR